MALATRKPPVKGLGPEGLNENAAQRAGMDALLSRHEAHPASQTPVGSTEICKEVSATKCQHLVSGGVGLAERLADDLVAVDQHVQGDRRTFQAMRLQAIQDGGVGGQR